MSARGSKLVREFMEREERKGWELVGRAGSGHWIAKHQPTGAVAFLPSSPSDHRSLLNCRAKMRRAVEFKVSHKE